MRGEWKRGTWGEVAILEYGKSLRGYVQSEGRYRVFGTNGPIGWHDEYLCIHPSVVIGRKGAYRGIHFSSAPFYAIDTAFYLEPKVPLDARWAYYCLLTYDINGLDSGSAIPSTSRDDFYRLPVSLPPLEEQRAIACILGALDDKIELNRKMNQTLEGIARAIFKNWFVDFDPVRAKSEGRDPGMPSEIADLFPSSFVDSELGEIPEEWKAGGFGDIAARRVQRLVNRHATVLSAVATGQLVRSDQHFQKRVYSQDTAKYLAVEQWDFAYNPSRANIGSIGMLEDAVLGAVSPVYVVFRPAPAYRWFLHFSLGRADIREWITTLASGSVRQSLSFEDFASVPCVIPPEAVVAAFNGLWNPIRESAAAKSNEVRTLAALRDSLLPKLISGELRVPDAERIVGRCV